MVEQVRLGRFWEMLKNFDWYYNMTDDHSVWQSAVRRKERLREIAETSEAHQELYKGFSKHAFSGEPFSNEQFPMPERPIEETSGLTETEG